MNQCPISNLRVAVSPWFITSLRGGTGEYPMANEPISNLRVAVSPWFKRHCEEALVNIQ
jgi:hypothetical protein